MVSIGQKIKYFSFVFVCGKYILFTLPLKLIHKRVDWDGKSFVSNCGVEQSQEITQGSNLWFQVHHVCTFTCYKNELTLDEISSFHFIFECVLPSGALHPTLKFLPVNIHYRGKSLRRHIPVLWGDAKMSALLSKRESCANS